MPAAPRTREYWANLESAFARAAEGPGVAIVGDGVGGGVVGWTRGRRETDWRPEVEQKEKE